MHRYLVGRQPVAAETMQPRMHRLGVLRSLEADACGDHVAGDRVAPTPHGCLADVVHLQQHALHLHRVYLLAADVDQIAAPTEDAHVGSVHLDQVLGVVPALGVERAGRVEVAHHGRFRADPEDALAHLALAADAAHLQPQGSRGPGACRQHSQLGEPIGLLEADSGKQALEVVQRARRHRLGAVGDEFERRDVVLAVGAGDDQHAQERGRGRQHLDAVSLDGRAHALRAPLAADDHGAAAGQGVQQGMHSAEMIEIQEHERAAGPARLAVALEQHGEVVQRRLALAGSARAQHDEPGGGARAQPGEERRRWRARAPRQGPRLVIVDGEEPPGVRQIERALRVPARRRDGDDDMALGDECQEQSHRRGRVVALDADDGARGDVIFPQHPSPLRQLLPEPAVADAPLRGRHRNAIGKA